MSDATDPMWSPRRHLRVVVLTCGDLGLETAAALEYVPGVDVLAVVTTPHRRGALRSRLRHIWRTRGWRGFIEIAVNKLRSRLPSRGGAGNGTSAHAPPRCPVLRFMDFHDEDCLLSLREMEPDLAVVDGTYILKESVFDLPRLGSINLHSGKVPEYRGTPPAFWELYDGVDRVGVTIHRVTAGLDEGPILLEEWFPLELAPKGDPAKYVRRYWKDVLRPNGVRMLAEAVASFGDGSARPRPQPRSNVAARRTPTVQQIRELRRRVRARRRTGTGTAPQSDEPAKATVREYGNN